MTYIPFSILSILFTISTCFFSCSTDLFFSDSIQSLKSKSFQKPMHINQQILRAELLFGVFSNWPWGDRRLSDGSAHGNVVLVGVVLLRTNTTQRYQAFIKLTESSTLEWLTAQIKTRYMGVFLDVFGLRSSCWSCHWNRTCSLCRTGTSGHKRSHILKHTHRAHGPTHK